MLQQPNKYAYPRILKACICKGDLGEGKHAHQHIIESGLDSDVIIGTTLIDMYAKCGSLEEAINVFDRLPSRTIVSWGVMMAGYAHHRRGLSALHLFEKMQLQGFQPDKIIYIGILKACGGMKGLIQGKFIHGEIIRRGLESDVVIGSTLVDMYAKCGNVEASRDSFNRMPARNMVSWGAMMSSYIQHGDGLSALDLYDRMQHEGIKPNKFIMSSILKGCGIVGDFTLGKKISEQIGRLGLKFDAILGNALVDMYAKCGKLDEACGAFASLTHQNVVSWGALIAGYVQHGCNNGAIRLFEEMQRKSIEPNSVILSCILKVYGSLGSVRQGKLVHDKIIRNGIGSDDIIACTLVDMYAKCGSLKDGRKLLDDLPQNIASWGAMISGYVEHGEPHHALELFQKLLLQDVEPNKVVCLCVLKACGSMGSSDHGMLVHSHMMGFGLEIDAVVGSSLVDMYAKCGSLEDAHKIFGKLPYQDVVSWGAMIVGYVQQGHDLSALKLFEDMQQAGTRPNQIIFPCILKACGNIGALVQGRLIHDLITRGKCESDAAIGNSLIEMYSRCGSLGDAQRLFDQLPVQDLGFVEQGEHKPVEQCLREMQRKGFKVHGTVSVNALSVYNCVGKMEQYPAYSNAMSHDLIPNMEEFNCMVDLLGRAGCLVEAEHLLQSTPVLPDAIGWTSLLAACRTYGNMELGRQCFDQVVHLGPNVTFGHAQT